MARGARTAVAVSISSDEAQLVERLEPLARKYDLTGHAAWRMLAEQRGIGYFEVLAAIDDPDETRNSGDGAIYIRGDVKVVVKGETIVTVADRLADSRPKSAPRRPVPPSEIATRRPRSQALDEAWALAPHDQPAHRFMLVTPEFAKKALDRNDKNRPYSKAQETEYTGLMEAGEWRGATPDTVSHQGIAFCRDGSIVQDGQHRLGAIQRSGKSYWMSVYVGMHPDNFPHLDRGRSRSYGDALAIAGFNKDRHVLGSITRMVYTYLNQGFASKAKVSPATVYREFLADAEGIQRAAVIGVRMEKGAKCTRTGAAAAYYLIRRLNDPDAVDEFFFSLSTGAMLADDDPRKTFRDSMVDALRRYGKMRRAGHEHLALILKTWKAYVEGKPIKQLVFRKNEHMPAVTRLKDYPQHQENGN